MYLWSGAGEQPIKASGTLGRMQEVTRECEHTLRTFTGDKKERVEKNNKEYKWPCRVLRCSEDSGETGQWKKRWSEPDIKEKAESIDVGLDVSPEAAGTG